MIRTGPSLILGKDLSQADGMARPDDFEHMLGVITDEDPEDDVPPDTTISRRIMTPGHDGTFSASLGVEGDWSGKTVLVNFFVDFLHTTGVGENWPGHYTDVGNYVYDPGLNSNATYAGIGGELWHREDNVSTTLGDGLFPVTYTHAEPVGFTCQ